MVLHLLTHPPVAAPLPDRAVLIALGLVSALVIVSVWRRLLRLVVIGALALALVGLFVLLAPNTPERSAGTPTQQELDMTLERG